jgi:hypothetical protein
LDSTTIENPKDEQTCKNRIDDVVQRRAILVVLSQHLHSSLLK